MDGQSERGRRGARSVASRGRGAMGAAARSPSQGRDAGGSRGGTSVTRSRVPRKDGAAARRSCPARGDSATAASGGAAAAASPCGAAASPCGAAAAGTAAVRRRAVQPDGGVSPPVSPAVGAPRMREVLSRLSLSRQDVSEASKLVNPVVSHLVRAIPIQDSSFASIECMGAGSYYERVKISEPDEFDIMFVIPATRLELHESDDTGAYYYVTLKRNPQKCWLKFLDEDGKLSAFKMLQALREIIKREVKNIKAADVAVKRKKAGSPAITLQIKSPPAEISVDIILALEVKQSWPPSTENGLKVEQWMARKRRQQFRLECFYLVAKQNKKEKVLKGDTWRLSFSHIEKDMLKDHGNSKSCCEADRPKCCRKECLKLLKHLLAQLKAQHPKQLEKFCSYHAKTAFFHSCVLWPDDRDWHFGDLDHCFQRYLGYFLDCLQKSHLPHFFIPQYNLLSLTDRASSCFLSRRINYELNNGFPIFQGRH